MRVLAAAALAGVVVAVLPATAALAADPKPDIAVTAAADKTSYPDGGAFVITVTVKNKSSVDAKHVHYVGGDSEGVEDVVFGEGETGFDLAAGATKTFPITGKVTHDAWRHGRGFVAFELAADNGEANNDDNVTAAQLKVPGAFADLTGVIFKATAYDSPYADGNPGVPGVKVIASTSDGNTKLGEGTTDAKGEFRITHLPAGDVRLTFATPPGWKVLLDETEKVEFTPAQIYAESEFGPRVIIPAKQVPITTASPSPSASAAASPSAGPALPVTGDNTMLLVGAGAVAVVIGVALVFVARRRRVHLQA